MFRISTAYDKHGRGRLARATREARNDRCAVSGTGIDLMRGASIPEAQLVLVDAEREDRAKAFLIADGTLATGDNEGVSIKWRDGVRRKAGRCLFRIQVQVFA